MTIIIFILVLGLLIFVHELGHFLAAKRAGVKVEEFALGFPPRLASFKRGETTYALNALPIGGYVKLLGEDAEEEGVSEDDRKRSFVNKGAKSQIFVLIAGVTMNVLLAWLLASLAFTMGYPTAAEEAQEQYVVDRETLIAFVLPDSPAAEAGVLSGDIVESVSDETRIIESPSAESISQFIKMSEDEAVALEVERRGRDMEFIVPVSGEILEDDQAIGITTSDVAFVQYPFFKALIEGAKWTYAVTEATVVGIGTLIGQAFQGEASFDTVAGPVGIVGLVGDAYAAGIIYLLTFTALISINLAIINLFPLPALDGGRILFVLIEKIKGSPIPKRFVIIANGVGFALLMLLMILVTIKDIATLAG